jgi:hypothetical protein
VRGRARAAAAFTEAAGGLRGPALAGLRASLLAARDRLAAPMRVAIIGRVSSGKSTLTNALLGGEAAPTGVAELTYNVNWLTYDDKPGITVHFRDGRPPQDRDRGELFDLAAGQTDLAAIDYLVVREPNAYLRDFDLIDTPGLDSVLGADSQNTLRFLGRTADDVRAESARHANRADALVVVFARGLAASEEALLAEFVGQGFGAGGPVATVGALTKVELTWPERPDPMAEGRRLCDRVMSAASTRKVLFDLRPVAGLVAVGAASFTPADFATLVELSGADRDGLERRLRRAPYFATRDYDDLPVPAPARAAVLRRFGPYGIALACGLLRDGVDDPAVLRAELTARSGIAEFKRLLTEHFGNRADLVKLRGLLDQAYRERDELAPRVDARARAALLDAFTPLLRFDADEHAFKELDVLRKHYDGRLDFDAEEVADLLRVTGEYGISRNARLGLPEDAPAFLAASAAREALARWAQRDIDPSYFGQTRRAVQVLRRTYEELVTSSS